MVFFFFQAEDGIRDAQESRGLGDVYKRQGPDGDQGGRILAVAGTRTQPPPADPAASRHDLQPVSYTHLTLPTIYPV